MAGQTLTVFNEDGEKKEVRLAKEKDRVRKDGSKNASRVIGKLTNFKPDDDIRNLTILHIDELAKASKKFSESTDNKHKWLDRNGWEYRNTYVQTPDGKIYRVKLNIARGDGGYILYDINNIKEVDHGLVSSGEDEAKNLLLNNNVPQNNKISSPKNAPMFSLKEESNITRNDVAALTGKDPYMAEAVKDLEDIMRMKGGEAFFRANQKELYKIYDEIAEEYHIKDYSKKRFADNVKELFDYIQSVDNPDGVDTTMLAMQIADDMLDKGSIKDTSMEELYPTFIY